MSRFARRKDINQREIEDALRTCGRWVLDISWAGRGVPDLLVWDHTGTYFVECKGKGEKLTEAEQCFWDMFPGDKYVVHSAEEAVALCLERDKRG